MKYKVNIEELYSRIIEIEANNEEDAENKVKKMYTKKSLMGKLGRYNSKEVNFYVQ